FPSRSLSLTLFLWNWQSDIGKPIEGYGEKGILPFKTGKKLSEKLLCVQLIHLTELHLSLQEAFR
ncbi:nef attachable domain protein, partial [Chlamydia psittaci C1/97]